MHSISPLNLSFLSTLMTLLLVSTSRTLRTGPSPEFSRYQRVHLEFSDPRTQKSSNQIDLKKLKDLDLTIVQQQQPQQGNNQSWVFILKLNEDLIADSYFEKRHEKGKYVTKRYKSRDEVELCHFQGKLRNVATSWAAFSTCHEINGIFYDGTNIYHVETIKASNGSQQQHYLYHGSDHHSMLNRFSSSSSSSNITNSPRKKRSISNDKNYMADEQEEKRKFEIKVPWNANTRSRYVELLLVVDNREYVEHDSDLEKIHRICKDVANVMNALYSPLNIYIALVGVVVWTEYDEIALSTNGDTTLTNFLHYRRERLVKDHPNDNAQLLTGIQFDGGVVGKALKGPMCTFEFSGGVNMWHSDVVGLVATTVAHEMGHNFGMEHDSEDCDCPDDRCIMAPASSTLKPSFWSSCSLEYLALAFEHGMDYCLRNKPVSLFQGPVCGNGFVEEGEECDCGLKHHCDNPCCNPDSCKLFPNATCATGECCDFATCRPKEPGQVCRLASHECDLPEFCTGISEFCPNDVFKVDGISCKVGKAYCYQGSCRTHSDQCKLLWGPSGKKSDNQCYEQNGEGSRHGNCGYNRLNNSYIKCPTDDVRCGMLHCSHLNERLEFGMESVAILSHTFINSGGTIIPCRTALVDLGLNNVDPGLAPEGSSCGDGKLCVNQKCMPVAALQIGPNSCPDDCNGNGICNGLGHCHCNPGYSGLDCLASGPGGSIDSGPASHPGELSPVRIFMFVCLGLLPLLMLMLLFFFLKKRGDLRLIMEKAKHSPREKKKSKKVIEIDVAENGGSSSTSSSPSHALLPHTESSTTGLSSDTKYFDAEDRREKENNLSLSKTRLLFASARKQSLGESYNNEQQQQQKKEKVSFMQNLARSITFPSAMKSREGGVKYEIKVEPKNNDDDATVVHTPMDEKSDFVLSGESSVVEVKVKSPTTDSKPKVPPRPSSPPVLNKEIKRSPSVPEPEIQNNPKLAFPHSSSYTSSGALKSSFLSASSPPPKPLVSSNFRLPPPVAKKPPLVTQAEPTPSALSPPITTSSMPLQSPFFKKSTTSQTSTKTSSPTSTMTKTSTLPPGMSSVAGVDPNLSKSSTLPLQPQRLQIGKPVLQTATSSAASIISKAPSTGISQSSILTTRADGKPEKKERCSRGVMFCDPLTLPSPTNPNNPPIIHQHNLASSPGRSSLSGSPSPPSTSKATSATIVTPQWTTKPGPLTSDAVICHIDESAEEQATKIAAPMAEPEGDSEDTKAESSSITSGARNSFRNMKISSPVLQSSIDIKTRLVPVCNTQSVPTPSPPSSSPTPQRTAPPPPVTPRGKHKSKAPASFAPKDKSFVEPGSNKESKKVPWRFGRGSSSVKNEKRDSAPVGEEVISKTADNKDTKKTSLEPTSSFSNKSRPASIATTRPVRPSAPPPKPPGPPIKTVEPVYEKINEEKSPEKEVLQKSSSSFPSTSAKPALPSKPLISPGAKPERPSSIRFSKDLTSPVEEVFSTPTSSPLFARKSPDTISVASSTDGDLMKEILKEMVVGKDNEEEEEIYSTLTRKKRKDKKQVK